MDYVLIPHEQIHIIDVKSMDVCLMTETVENFHLNRCEKNTGPFCFTLGGGITELWP